MVHKCIQDLKKHVVSLSSIDINNVETETKVYIISGDDPGIDSMLHFKKTNRDVVPSQSKRIKKNMKATSGWHFPEVTVNIATWNVLDGQNRVQGIRSMKPAEKADVLLGVKFIWCEEKDEDALIQDLNQKQKKWRTSDYILKFIKKNEPDHVKWYKFVAEHQSEMLKNQKKSISFDPAQTSIDQINNIMVEYPCAFLWGGQPEALVKESKKFSGLEQLNKARINAANKRFNDFMHIMNVFKKHGAKRGNWMSRMAEAWYSISEDDECSPFISKLQMTGIAANIEKHISQTHKIPHTVAANEWKDWLKHVGLGNMTVAIPQSMV